MSETETVYILTMYAERGHKVAVWAFDSAAKAMGKRGEIDSSVTNPRYFLIDKLKVQ